MSLIFRCLQIAPIAFLLLHQCTIASAADVAVFSPRPARIADGINTSQARLYPDSMTAAAIGDYSVLIAIGKEGVAIGGGLLVDFPKSWFTNPLPLVKPVQSEDPAGPHFLECRTYREGASLEVSVDHRNFDGSIERFRQVVNVIVREHALFEGDTVRVSLKHSTAPIVSGADAVRVAVDAAGDGRFLLATPAPYTVHPGPAVSALVVAPSDAVIGEPLDVHVALFDSLSNLAEGFSGALAVGGLGPDATPVTMGPGRAIAKIRWTPSDAGYVFPEITGALHAIGGPIRVHVTAPARRVYWGDLHSHSDASKDGIGTGEYAFARDVTRLDFYASTEHGIDDGTIMRDEPGDSISPSEWEQNIADVKRYYEPGRFVTLLGYECSLPNGHHNVFYRGDSGQPWPEHRVKSVERLWELLAAGDAITIPHHLGIRWGGSDAPVTGPELQPIITGGSGVGGPALDWTRGHDAALRPLLEIYSAHGQSEFFDRSDALAYEQVKYTGARSADGPHYARDAWAAGLPMGVIASSDDHQAHPGLPHQGLAAVLAPELTRDAVFDALRARRSYGTTGARILIEFSAGAFEMGQQGKASGAMQGRAVVAAPSPIASAEVFAIIAGSTQWKTLVRWDHPGRLLEEGFTVDVVAPMTIYLRAELENKTNGRVARAWSSPIWLTP